MDVSDLLDALNDAQREAVAAPPGNMLVVAGAGSGKTRVLAHRIGYLVRTGEASVNQIFAVTFTNKAAREMRDRIEAMLNLPTRHMWVGTFHGLAHRLLRTHWREAGLPQTFQILDSDDQFRTIRRVLKALELDESRYPPKQAQWFINARKDEGQRPRHLDHQGDPFQKKLIEIYAGYEELCKRSGLVDFAELLLRAHELWRDNPALLEHYRERFRHVLVDEFQDTSTIQYAWLRLLAGDKLPVFAVGDDDQSIYGWRGARIENIQHFSEQFPHTRVFRLEQNYRSTATILSAANELIANNPERLGKNLWTAGEEGDSIKVYAAYNDLDEARFVAERIADAVADGVTRSEIAILYRSNAQSRVLEEALLRQAIPYRVYGGLRFFERAEIKDALAYLRLIASRSDDASFERVVNTPTRGIGERTLQIVRDYARANQVTLWEAASTVLSNGSMTARAANALSAFQQLIETMAAACDGISLTESVEHTLRYSTLLDHHKRDKSEKGQMRVENLEELVTAARQFDLDDEIESSLPEFLAHAALEAGEGQADAWQECVQLMTLHSAKGLEFDLVFLTGMEEGLFPHSMSLEEAGRLAEERRLCYVGMTRAKKNLCLSYAEVRRLHGNETYSRPSRFLSEIPREYLDEIRPGKVTRYADSGFGSGYEVRETSECEGLSLGQRVSHAKFGEGVVLNYEGQGSHARVQVSFRDVGDKWLVLAYANLQPV